MTVQEKIAVMLTHQLAFGSVIPFSAEKDKLTALDLSVKNQTISKDIFSDTGMFSGWINNKLQANNARFGIGGYNEHRAIYCMSKVFNSDSPGDEPRRLHLGTDIWGKPHTAVMAPLDGIIHSFAFNNNPGDYGATIILAHKLDEITFYTLYGHLSLHSIKNIHEGDRVNKGDIVAEFGIPTENGGWPPHLHFQVILDMGFPQAIKRKGDYPGVCKFSEREKWLINSPDPDMILQLNQYL
jgi:murein DD-endopeptidase MepM/ murein hydrolase activator NlpD